MTRLLYAAVWLLTFVVLAALAGATFGPHIGGAELGVLALAASGVTWLAVRMRRSRRRSAQSV